MSERILPEDNSFAATGNSPRSDEQPTRVWRACLECRRKKSKCDGKDTCRLCMIRNQECVYLESHDNASASRQSGATLEKRYQLMEQQHNRMGTLVDRLDSIVTSLDDILPRDSTQSLLRGPLSKDASPHVVTRVASQPSPEIDPDSFQCSSGEQQHIEKPDEREFDLVEKDILDNVGWKKVDHVMTTDSYGKLRFVGGTSTMIMIEALKSLTPSSSLSYSPAEVNTGEKSVSNLELPFFRRGVVFPRLPSLPKAEELLRPPRYVSDLLVNIYFDQLHFTMPVIYKPHFMQRYFLLQNDRSGSSIDSGFLSVFFAVCACASGLLPRESGVATSFSGLQYYENALTLHYASTGEGSMEQVQCLALLSMCSAGWNTLAQSWKFAGQAIRAAQDLGLHRSPARGAGEVLKEELCRRVWWSVYDLDRLLSICLGRPMGVEDDDCDCEMPLDMDDIGLEAYCKESPHNSTHIFSQASRMSGFLAFSRLCRIAGKISRTVNPLRISRMCQNRQERNSTQLQKSIKELDSELSEWLESVPDAIKFSVNNNDSESPHLTMCIISYILHAGCTINLHRLLIPDTPDSWETRTQNTSHIRCVNAARSCIQVAELMRERIPPSHHLAFCANYLALSGVILLRSSESLTNPITQEIEACIRYLAKLENIWIGAKRSRNILEELLNNSKASNSNKRKFPEFLNGYSVPDYITGEELFGDWF